MAAGATAEEVKKVIQIMAHTARQLEAGTMPLELGPETRRLLCRKRSTDDEFFFGRTYLASTAWTSSAR